MSSKYASNLAMAYSCVRKKEKMFSLDQQSKLLAVFNIYMIYIVITDEFYKVWLHYLDYFELFYFIIFLWLLFKTVIVMYSFKYAK